MSAGLIALVEEDGLPAAGHPVVETGVHEVHRPGAQKQQGQQGGQKAPGPVLVSLVHTVLAIPREGAEIRIDEGGDAGEGENGPGRQNRQQQGPSRRGAKVLHPFQGVPGPEHHRHGPQEQPEGQRRADPGLPSGEDHPQGRGLLGEHVLQQPVARRGPFPQQGGAQHPQGAEKPGGPEKDPGHVNKAKGQRPAQGRGQPLPAGAPKALGDLSQPVEKTPGDKGPPRPVPKAADEIDQ